jgi:phosphoenolpyruvate-protein kinase (PTS system EI component)
MTRWIGSGVAPGTALAPSWRADRPPPAPAGPVSPADVEAAFHAVADQFDDLARRAAADGRRAAAEIVSVGALIARDPLLVDAARGAVAGAGDPLPAVRRAVDGQAALLDALPDPVLRERAADVRQVGRRVVARLAGAPAPPPDTFVLVAAEIGPADLLEHLDAGLVAAAAVRGGANSHAAIIARSVGVPLVTGVDPALVDLADHTPLLVDGDAGVVVVAPRAGEAARAGAEAARAARREAGYATERRRPHRTADGVAFTLWCNVASDVEARRGRDAGAEGIGLFRTELPFLDARGWPTPAAHRRALVPVFAAAAGWPVTVRLLDFTNDKVPPFLRGTAAGLTALLADGDALADQVRAVLDTGRGTDLRIMVPMVTGPDDLTRVRETVAAVAAELGVGAPPVGAMIETVAALRGVEDLARRADFFSIGTNDLVGAVLGLDRRDPRAGPDLVTDPRVLRPVGDVVAAAGRAGIPVGVCGDAAAHPATLPLLVGAGVRAVSVACARVDRTRYLLRRLRTDECRDRYAGAVAA